MDGSRVFCRKDCEGNMSLFVVSMLTSSSSLFFSPHWVIQTLDVLLQVLVVYPKIEPLRIKVRVKYGYREVLVLFGSCWVCIHFHFSFFVLIFSFSNLVLIFYFQLILCLAQVFLSTFFFWFSLFTFQLKIQHKL